MHVAKPPDPDHDWHQLLSEMSAMYRHLAGKTAEQTVEQCEPTEEDN
jgi:hypothetical protein